MISIKYAQKNQNNFKFQPILEQSFFGWTALVQGKKIKMVKIACTLSNLKKPSSSEQLGQFQLILIQSIQMGGKGSTLLTFSPRWDVNEIVKFTGDKFS